MTHISTKLKEKLKKGECVLFVGSGLSLRSMKKDSGGSKLLKKIVSQLGKDVPLTRTHKTLAELPFKAVVTTNYDHLLEKALSKRNVARYMIG